MNKQLLGKALSLLGKPTLYAITTTTVSVSAGKYSNLWWSIPFGLLTFPLLPLALKGNSMLKQSEEDNFAERTKDLPKVVLPKDYCYIENNPTVGWIVQPFYFDQEEDPFENETEARLFLQSLSYTEVVSADCQQNQTFWIKNG